MSGKVGQHVIGRYGAGTLWCLRTADAFVIQFNARKIAKRSLKGGAWTALETGWKVTPYEGGEIHVQLNNSEGVIVSLNSSTGSDLATAARAYEPGARAGESTRTAERRRTMRRLKRASR
jgi:hypothetical protein